MMSFSNGVNWARQAGAWASKNIRPNINLTFGLGNSDQQGMNMNRFDAPSSAGSPVTGVTAFGQTLHPAPLPLRFGQPGGTSNYGSSGGSPDQAASVSGQVSQNQPSTPSVSGGVNNQSGNPPSSLALRFGEQAPGSTSGSQGNTSNLSANNAGGPSPSYTSPPGQTQGSYGAYSTTLKFGMDRVWNWLSSLSPFSTGKASPLESMTPGAKLPQASPPSPQGLRKFGENSATQQAPMNFLA